MTASNQVVKDVAAQEYKYGFVTDVESEVAPPGLSEETVRSVSYTHLTLPTSDLV